MAKTNKKHPHRIPIYRRTWFIVLVALIVLAIIAYFILHASNSAQVAESDTISSSSSADVTDDTTNGIATSASGTSTSNNESSDEPEKVIQYEGEDPNTMENIEGFIARSSTDGTNLTIVVQLAQFLSETGRCDLVLKDSQGKQVYTASSQTLTDAQTSVCEAFVVPIGNLPSGEYQIEVEVSGDGKQGKINGEVSL